MITKIEYGQFLKEGEPALNIVFTYDDSYSDSYEIWGERNVSHTIACMETQPLPEELLIELRQMVGSTVH